MFGLSRVARVHATREIETLSLSLFLRSPNAASPRNVLRLTRANTGEKEESLVGSRKEDFCRSRIFCRPNDGCCFLEGVYYGGIIARGMGKYFVTMIR